MSNVHVFDHPLIQHKLSILRDKDTGAKAFRELVGEIAMLMCYEATRDLPLEEVMIETPVATAKCRQIAGKKLAIVPILRAGLGMVDGMFALMPNVKVGHIGLYRDPETLEPVKYYFKMPPDISERDVIIVDPMLATGGSAAAAAMFLKEVGVKHIKLMSIIAAPEGVQRMQSEHPDVDIFVARAGRPPERARLYRPPASGTRATAFSAQNKRSSNYLNSPEGPSSTAKSQPVRRLRFFNYSGLARDRPCRASGALHPGAAWRRRNRDCGLFCKSGKARANLSR